MAFSRIVSLVPSQTELLSSLGLDEQIVGITKFCVHPEHVYRNKTRVGGTKEVDLDKVRVLKPDLILANKEENVKDQIEALAKEYTVHVTDVHDLDSALDMIQEVGRLCNRSKEGRQLSEEIRLEFQALVPLSAPLRTLYLIWKDPYMTIGRDTFIHDLLSRCGFLNVFAESERYPAFELSEIDAPEVVLLSSEPYPFKQKHIDELQAVWPEVRFELVDGEYFSWYGSRLMGSAGYFKGLVERLGGIA